MSHRAAKTVVATVLAALLSVALPGCMAGVQIGSRLLGVPSDGDPDLDGTGWLHTRSGVALTDVVQVDGEPYIPSFEAVPSLGIGWSWRVATFDFGGHIEHFPGGPTQTLDGRPVRLGGQSMVAGSIRWRFIDRRWGGFYLRFNPGLGIFGTTETLRGAIAERQGRAPRGIAKAGAGFAYSAAAGLFANLADWLVLQVDAGASGLHGALTVDGESQRYERYRGLIRAGLEWRL